MDYKINDALKTVFRSSFHRINKMSSNRETK